MPEPRPAVRSRPRTSAVATGTSLLALGLALAGCGQDSPRTLLPAIATAAPDHQRVTCDLATPDAVVSFALVLPDSFVPATAADGVGAENADCTWLDPASQPAPDPAGPSVVQVSWVGDTEDLQDLYAAERPYVSEDGDDAISDLRLDQDVAVYGDTVGDRLRWACFCDGAPDVTYVAQAAGVRVRWGAPQTLRERTETDLATALAGAGTA